MIIAEKCLREFLQKLERPNTISVVFGVIMNGKILKDSALVVGPLHRKRNSLKGDVKNVEER